MTDEERRALALCLREIVGNIVLTERVVADLADELFGRTKAGREELKGLGVQFERTAAMRGRVIDLIDQWAPGILDEIAP